MINVEKLKVWEAYEGDYDIASHSGSTYGGGILEGWSEIDALVSDLRVVGRHPVAQSFVDDLNRRMMTLVQDDAAREMVRRLAAGSIPWAHA